ncbi:hypothetical protein RIR_e37669_A0A2N1NIN0_9GLOM [Rhizophagus irregularis DAOM 181602=DAOM 197198]|uniref:Uncharacterized protein n=1 Tax=Rhizophagus irregularis TaxID=588596 RepID=A0A2N1NIN0_9GLOM|nr:hypothetical protein RhiirC2_740305 [Rhizophagus irregularis]GET60766.1 hypothetical protein RIR_e37669_A0A2N1NIN0_9GLOM [Rhizophagus irregularis DAOM 181602=DAOM 197198]
MICHNGKKLRKIKKYHNGISCHLTYYQILVICIVLIEIFHHCLENGKMGTCVRI